MKRLKSLHFALVIRYTVFFVISLIAIFAFMVIYLNSMLHSMQFDELYKQARLVEVSGDYSDGTFEIKNLPNGMIWYDVIENNEVVYTYGDREIDKTQFSDDELNYLVNVDTYGMNTYHYVVKPYVYTSTTGKHQWILAFSAIDTSFNVGVNVPDEFKDTEFERGLEQLGQFMLIGIIVALSVVILIFSIITFRIIIKPIRKLNVGLMAVKQGELGTRIDYSGFNELKELTDSFNVMTDRLETVEEEARHLSESKKSLLMNISHDLRTPATIVQGYSRALVDDVVPDEKKVEYYEFINSKSTMITNRLNQLFSYVKFDLSEFDLTLKPENFVEFIRRLTISYLPDIESKSQEIDLDIPDDQVIVKLDQIELERAIGNIIENAVKYNPSGTQITIKLEVQKDLLKLVIKDNGIGISKTEMDKIFTPFVRGDKTRKSEGTGLGLAISKQIVEKHGGHLSIHDVEIGTEFIVELPILL